MAKILWPLLGMLLLPGLGLTVDVPPITPADFPVDASPAAHWIWAVLASPVVAAVAYWLFTQILDRVKDSRIRRALLAIHSAVAVVYKDFVRGVKTDSPNGKLTIDQKNAALQMAQAKAMEIAKSQGVDLFKVFTKETVLALTEYFVGKSKGKAVSPPLPDLLP